MATYHFHVNVGKKGRAASHATYVVRAGEYTPERAGKRYEDLEAYAHGNMPNWAVSNPIDFWEASDKYERANGSTYREFEAALPRELSPDQRKELVADFVEQALGKSHAFTYGIHCPLAKLEGGEQPHVHIMYSERVLDDIDRGPDTFFKRYNAKNPENGGARKDSAGTQERLAQIRELWATVTNEHLAKAGFDLTVDHRSNKERGINEEPEFHLGWWSSEEKRMAILNRRAAKIEAKLTKEQVAQLNINEKLQELTDEKALAEYDEHLKMLEGQEKEYQAFDAEIQAQIETWEAEQLKQLESPLRQREKKMQEEVMAQFFNKPKESALRKKEKEIEAEVMAQFTKPKMSEQEIQLRKAVKNAAKAQCVTESKVWDVLKKLEETEPEKVLERVEFWSSMSDEEIKKRADQEMVRRAEAAQKFVKEEVQQTIKKPEETKNEKDDDFGLGR